MAIDDPFAIFQDLYARAAERCAEPDAMVLSTADADGRPSGRNVLLKEVDARGFVFYTNLGSRKAQALAVNPFAALTFYWPPDKQVHIEGGVERVSDAEADAYFATRPRGSQIGAWASSQSQPLISRAELDLRIGETERRFDGVAVPRPPFWTGFRVMPQSIEFWTRDVARLHERVRFDRAGEGWSRSLRFP